MNPVQRECADCAVEFGVMNRADSHKSHGMCRRHFIGFCQEAGLTPEEIRAELAGASSSAFCPDMREEGLAHA